ncbi:WD40 repeat-like protein [Rhizopus microsporus var. microsporus]|uniref:Serine-threonine kinase receptor-associated protein n=2 Tax=Rhizopus microsporus TaxID=58291 RepID=A0A2G4SQQ0_RHIZD|nr:serine-threonine kinase receptor-associated protein [Rhizopus microsporus ATCC 52813]ORE08432.1 WD40 repeat-like protein [Rhizopus microsporus var. microsporus]PHZ11093.1 serine-threonine kinase receptor-associated protein [Rhizopus microsporus ATCC 52813]
MNTSRVIPLTCSGHTRPVVDLHFSPMARDGRYYLISACKDGNPMLRDGITGDWIGTFEGHKGAVWSARLSKDATKAVTGSADFTAKIWNTQTGKEVHSFSHQHIVRTAEFSEDNTKIVTGGQEGLLRIFDLYRPEAHPLEVPGHEGTIKAVVWDEANHAVLSAGDDATVRIWDLRTMRERGMIQTKPVSTMTLSMDGQYVCWAAGKTANFWKPDSPLEDVKTIETKEKTSSVSLHPDHQKFVAGSDEDLWVRIYDFNTAEVKDVYKGHHGPIHTVSYSPDGQIYATGSEDGTIRLWQTDPSQPYGLWQKPVEA